MADDVTTKLSDEITPVWELTTEKYHEAKRVLAICDDTPKDAPSRQLVECSIALYEARAELIRVSPIVTAAEKLIVPGVGKAAFVEWHENLDALYAAVRAAKGGE
jgi:hypothetical protein